MSQRSSIFDMIGPVMIGPSSSHTAGVVRIGKVARKLLTQKPEEVRITFYNSFARTYEGHGSDRAVVAGLLDMETDDSNIREALRMAREGGMNISFKAVTNASALHPNSVRIYAKTKDADFDILGVSRGGGLVSVVEVEGFRCNISTQHHTLLIGANDIPGSIAFISTVLQHEHCNIATMTVDRKGKNQKAFMVLEVDSEVRQLTVDFMESQSWIQRVIYLPQISA